MSMATPRHTSLVFSRDLFVRSFQESVDPAPKVNLVSTGASRYCEMDQETILFFWDADFADSSGLLEIAPSADHGGRRRIEDICNVLNVLIVEDDFMLGDMLRDALEDVGYCVTGVARTVDEAMRSAEQQPNDLAVIDLHLAQGGLGTEVAQRLRGNAAIGVMFSTGDDDGTLTIEQGDAVMTKPYRMQDIARGLRIISELGEFGRTELPFPRNFRLLETAPT
jgi:CheY-like chemotaxis protein